MKKKYKFKKLILLILLTVNILSCQNKKDNQLETAFSNKDRIDGKIFEVDNLFIGSPRKIMSTKKLLIIVDDIKRNFIKIIDIDSRKLITQFGEKGRGPNEIVFLSDIWLDEKNNRLELFDSKLNIIYSISLDSLDSLNLGQAKKTYLNDTPDNFKRMRHSKLHRLNDSLIISSGFFDQGRFALVNGEGKFKQIFDDYDFYGEEFSMLNDIEKSIVLQGQFAISLKDEKIAFSTTKSACLQIYRYTGNKLSTIKKTKYYVSPGMRQAGTVATSKKVPIAFMAMTSNDKFIYLLYSGKRIDIHGESAEICDRIFVYNWEGVPIKEIKPNYSLIDICFNKEKKILIGVSALPEPQIIFFQL